MPKLHEVPARETVVKVCGAVSNALAPNDRGMGRLQEPGDGGVGLRVGAAVGGLYVILSVPEPAGVRSSQLQVVRE